MRTMCASLFDILPNAYVVRKGYVCKSLKNALENAKTLC